MEVKEVKFKMVNLMIREYLNGDVLCWLLLFRNRFGGNYSDLIWKMVRVGEYKDAKHIIFLIFSTFYEISLNTSYGDQIWDFKLQF